MSVTARGKKWEFWHSLWVCWPLFLHLGWVGFFVIGIRAKKKSWIFWGVAYLLLWADLIVLLASDLTAPGGPLEIALGILLLVGWIVPFVHLLCCRRKFLLRRDAILSGRSPDEAVRADALRNTAQPQVAPYNTPGTQTYVVPNTNLPTAQPYAAPTDAQPLGPPYAAPTDTPLNNSPHQAPESVQPYTTTQIHTADAPVKARKGPLWAAIACGALAVVAAVCLLWPWPVTQQQRHAWEWRYIDVPGGVLYYNSSLDVTFTLPADAGQYTVGQLLSGGFKEPGGRLYLRKLETENHESASIYDCSDGEPRLVAIDAYGWSGAAAGDLLYYYADWDKLTGRATLMKSVRGGAPEAVATGCFGDAGFAISPDGNTVLYTEGGMSDGALAMTLCLLHADGSVERLEDDCIPIAVADDAKYVYYAKAEYDLPEGDYRFLRKATAYARGETGRVAIASTQDEFRSRIDFAFNEDLSLVMASCLDTGTVVCSDATDIRQISDQRLSLSNSIWRDGDVPYGRDLDCGGFYTLFFLTPDFDGAITGWWDADDDMRLGLVTVKDGAHSMMEIPASASFGGGGKRMAFIDYDSELFVTSDPTAWENASYVPSSCTPSAVAMSDSGKTVFYISTTGWLYIDQLDGNPSVTIDMCVRQFGAIPGTEDCIFLNDDGQLFRTGPDGVKVLLLELSPTATMTQNGDAIIISETYDDPDVEFHSLTHAAYVYVDGMLYTVYESDAPMPERTEPPESTEPPEATESPEPPPEEMLLDEI